MTKSTKKYYLENSVEFGWGAGDLKLDDQRQELLDKYVIGPKILDVGCSIGLYVDYLSKIGFDAWGVDFVSKFIKIARNTKKGTFRKSNANNLPFKNDSFNTVLLFDILEHTDDSRVLKEAIRVAKDRLLIIVPRKVDRELEQNGVIFRHYIDKTHLREYDSKSIKSLCMSLDLKVLHCIPIHPLNNRGLLFSLFEGSTITKRILIKLFLFLLKKKVFLTEYLIVLEK